MTIAIVTTHDRSLLATFGHGSTTLLADLEGDCLVRPRELPPVEGCCGAIARALAGCEAVLCTGIGRGAAHHLEEMGVAVVIAGAVHPDAAVRAWRAGQPQADNAGCGCGNSHQDHDHATGGACCATE